jgi:hypothetical protein
VKKTCCKTLFLKIKYYLCNVIKDNNNRLTQTVQVLKRRKIMTMTKEITMLRYQIERYQILRNGAMCQALNAKLNKLIAE